MCDCVILARLSSGFFRIKLVNYPSCSAPTVHCCFNHGHWNSYVFGVIYIYMGFEWEWLRRLVSRLCLAMWLCFIFMSSSAKVTWQPCLSSVRCRSLILNVSGPSWKPPPWESPVLDDYMFSWVLGLLSSNDQLKVVFKKTFSFFIWSHC